MKPETREPVNILLVDDQPSKLLAYEAALACLGENLVTVGSARAALEMLLEREIAVVLADVCMPEIDGFDLLAMIRRHPRFRDTAVILVSSIQVGDPDQLKGYDSGAVDYLPVPFAPEVLRAKVRVFVDLFRKTRELQALNRRLEQLVEARTAELRRSNRDLEQFAYAASHDLQEPLRMISSFLQLLSRRYSGRLDAQADEFIAFASGSAQRMHAMINDLLSYARLDLAGAHFTPVACDRALQQALANLRLAIRENGATVTQGSLPTVMGDEFQVAQVFQNLVGNAIKFRRKEVDPVVHVDCDLRDGEWLLSVRDNGIGLDPTYAQRIFEVFQRLHGREEYAGTGIGLSLCKKIVERHGGTIWCESSPGSGSTFYFTLPIAPASRTSRLGSEPLPLQAQPSPMP